MEHSSGNYRSREKTFSQGKQAPASSTDQTNIPNPAQSQNISWKDYKVTIENIETPLVQKLEQSETAFNLLPFDLRQRFIQQAVQENSSLKFETKFDFKEWVTQQISLNLNGITLGENQFTVIRTVESRTPQAQKNSIVMDFLHKSANGIYSETACKEFLYNTKIEYSQLKNSTQQQTPFDQFIVSKFKAWAPKREIDNFDNLIAQEGINLQREKIKSDGHCFYNAALYHFREFLPPHGKENLSRALQLRWAIRDKANEIKTTFYDNQGSLTQQGKIFFQNLEGNMGISYSQKLNIKFTLSYENLIELTTSDPNFITGEGKNGPIWAESSYALFLSMVTQKPVFILTSNPSSFENKLYMENYNFQMDGLPWPGNTSPILLSSTNNNHFDALIPKRAPEAEADRPILKTIEDQIPNSPVLRFAKITENPDSFFNATDLFSSHPQPHRLNKITQYKTQIQNHFYPKSSQTVIAGGHHYEKTNPNHPRLQKAKKQFEGLANPKVRDNYMYWTQQKNLENFNSSNYSPSLNNNSSTLPNFEQLLPALTSIHNKPIEVYYQNLDGTTGKDIYDLNYKGETLPINVEPIRLFRKANGTFDRIIPASE